jgi:hypothetical protein
VDEDGLILTQMAAFTAVTGVRIPLGTPVKSVAYVIARSATNFLPEISRTGVAWMRIDWRIQQSNNLFFVGSFRHARISMDAVLMLSGRNGIRYREGRRRTHRALGVISS